jgi:perosamine synthetase
VIASLASDGVQSARYLPVIHLQQYMRELYGFAEGLCPVAESLARRTLAIPFHTGIGAGEQERVAAALERALG